MEINKSIGLYANVLINDKIVANLTANIINNGLNYNIGVNYIDKATIDATPENKASFESDRLTFENEVKALLV